MGEKIASIMAAIVGVALVAVVVQSPNTSKVITSGATGFATTLRAAQGR